MEIKDLIQTGDWKGEKHVPVIEVKEKGEWVVVEVSVGKEIPHPNTPEHHIQWLELYFQPEGSKFPFLVGRWEAAGHGYGDSTLFTDPYLIARFKTEKSGTLYALSFCNIHGLWSSSTELKL